MTKKTTPAQKGNVSTKANAKAAAQVANQMVANRIVQQLDALSVVREKWESTDYKKANEGLYNLLAQCLGLFTTSYTKAAKSAKVALRNELAGKLKADGVRVVLKAHRKVGR
jgi:hypothetical protein